MSASQITVIAIMVPKAGAAERFEALVKEVMPQVESKEPDVSMYELHKTRNPKEGSEYIFVEKYKDGAALKTHGATSHFQAFQKAITKEGLMEKPTTLKILKPVGGFSRDSGSKL